MLKCRLRQPEENCGWKCPEGMNPLLHRLLLTRGVKSDEEARMFMHPGREMLRDPFLLSSMREAVDIINDAVQKKESICVYGDYDVDGVCASAILAGYLKEQGARCDVYLPSRHTEGYGLNADAVDSIARDHSLLITVDCGITAFELVERAKANGMRVIVTDHHRPDDRLPDCPTVNPLLGGYPFGFLCGTGVAFQLVTALAGRDKAMEYIDLAALATIADIVPLRDENRAIAALGLKKINISARPGVRALIEVSGLDGREIGAGNVAFQMTPRLNASGRLGDAKRAYDLLTSTDADVCEALAKELDEENKNRKNLEDAAIDTAEQQLLEFDFTARRVIIVEGDDWNPGVIGLTASRLTEKYHYPTVALTRDGDAYTGSCRSIEGVDIHAALSSVSELLERFGGHKMAAGLKVKAENLESFKQGLNEYLIKNCDSALWIPAAEYDAEAEGRELTEELVSQIEALAPTGCGNPSAVLKTRGTVIESRGVGKEGEHLKLTLKTRDGMKLPGIWFRHACDAPAPDSEVELLYSPSVNEFMGKRSVQADVKSILACDVTGDTGTGSKRFAAFTKWLAEGFTAGDRKTPVMLSNLKAEFALSHQGALVICADADSAATVLSAAGGNADIYSGAFPTDPRAFNAVCVCPSGELPARYKKVYYAGVPGAMCARGLRISGVSADSRFEMPDIAMLRQIVRAVKTAAESRTVYENAGDAAVKLSRNSGMGSGMFAMGLGLLARMGTAGEIRVPGGIVFTYSPAKKNPAEDELFKAFFPTEDGI